MGARRSPHSAIAWWVPRCTHAARQGTRVAQTGLLSHDLKAKVEANLSGVAPERKAWNLSC